MVRKKHSKDKKLHNDEGCTTVMSSIQIGRKLLTFSQKTQK